MKEGVEGPWSLWPKDKIVKCIQAGGTYIPTFSCQTRKQLCIFHFCDSLHLNVRKSLLQLSSSLTSLIRHNQKPKSSFPLTLCSNIQGLFTSSCPLENFSCFSYFTPDLFPKSPSSCPLGLEFFLPAFLQFHRLSKTFCFLVADWRWRGWFVWWPDECCSQNPAVMTAVELQMVEGEGFSMYNV